MNRIDFDRTMNSIVKDFIVLFVFLLIAIVGLGIRLEHGDVNSGSMLGVVYVFPLIPIILLSLGLIKICESFFKNHIKWIASFAPIVLIIGSFWLKPFNTYILAAIIVVICLYFFFKKDF